MCFVSSGNTKSNVSGPLEIVLCKNCVVGFLLRSVSDTKVQKIRARFLEGAKTRLLLCTAENRDPRAQIDALMYVSIKHWKYSGTRAITNLLSAINVKLKTKKRRNA